MNLLSIGQVAKAVGISVETVRFYEKQGLLLAPMRSESGYRQYKPDTLKQLRFIQRAKKVGFTLNEIKELLSLRKIPNSNCTNLKQRALKKIGEIDAKLNDLNRIRDSLSQLSRRCNSEENIVDCPILEYLDDDKRNEKDESRTHL